MSANESQGQEQQGSVPGTQRPRIISITFTILDPAYFTSPQATQSATSQTESTNADPTSSPSVESNDQPSSEEASGQTSLDNDEASPQQHTFQLPLPVLFALQQFLTNAFRSEGGVASNGAPQQQGQPGSADGGGSWMNLADFLNHTFQIHQMQRAGPPPASASAVDTLHEIEIVDEANKLHGKDCAVCQDCFKVGEKAVQLPCDHYYHPDCVKPWLKEHNTCPTCRYELPTDDSEYEEGRKERMEQRDEAKRLRECQCELGRIRKTDCCLLGEPTMVTLECGHKLHRECAVEWARAQRNGKCPVCNQRVSFPQDNSESASASPEGKIEDEAHLAKRRKMEEDEAKDDVENPAEEMETSISADDSSVSQQTII